MGKKSGQPAKSSRSSQAAARPFSVRPFLVVMLILLIGGLSCIGADALLTRGATGEASDASHTAAEIPADRADAASSADASAPNGAYIIRRVEDRYEEFLDPQAGLKRCFTSLDALAESDTDARDEVRTLGDMSDVSEQTLTSLADALHAAEQDAHKVAFVLLDLNTGRGLAYNTDTLFFSASVVKGPYIASLAAAEPASVAERPQAMELTLEESDNASYEALSKRYGRGCFKAWWEEAGVRTAFSTNMYIDLTAEDLARLWLKVYDFLLNDVNRDLVGGWLEHPNESSIHRLLADSYTTRTKGGWNINSYAASHDAGIVYAPSPYLLVILTDYPETMEQLDPYVELLEQAHNEMSVH